MWGKLGLVLMKFAEKKQLVKFAAASHTGFLTTGNFHQKHCVSNFSEPPRIREFSDEKKWLHGHQYHHPGSGAARNLKIPSCQKNHVFFETWQLTSPKKFASPCYVFVGEFLKPLPKILPFTCQKSPEISHLFVQSQRSWTLGDKKKDWISSQSQFLKPYAIFFGILLLLRLDSFFLGCLNQILMIPCFWVAL